MFSKKCMVVGSLLVMAAQTATAVQQCSAVSGAAKTTLCARPNYTGAKITANDGTDCANDPCSGAADAVLCCVPTALCNTISTPTTFCGSEPYVQPGALIAAANTTRCQGFATDDGDGDPSGATCSTAGASTDEATCCVPRANCDTISTVAATFCAGDAYTGAFKSADVNLRCAGATCVSGDAAACCAEKATCDSLNDAGASPNLAEVCSAVDYSGALIGAGSAYKCATATCQNSDADACCKRAKAQCSSITAAGSTFTICGDSTLNSANANSDCSGDTCGIGDKSTCCNVATTCTSDYDKGDNMVASGAGTARGTTIKFTCDSGYAADNNGDVKCTDQGGWEGGECTEVTPTCSVTDGSKATPWTGGTAAYEPCTCTGAAKKCATLNVCDVAKKTCVCTPGKDHWCYEDAEHSFAVKFGCMADGSEFSGWKCVGDNVLEAKYSDAACTTHITVADGGDEKTFSATEKTTVEKEDGTVITKVDTTTTGISTCKGGVAGAGATAPGAAAPSPAAPSPAGTSPSATLGENAGSVTQCSTLAMLIVVAAMWAGRN